ncbi:MAG: hypothetical protein QOI56_187, partial [Actinomycetota bacterium]|nr:hypothetical protein [Actinomycetota bacterium]
METGSTGMQVLDEEACVALLTATPVGRVAVVVD